MIFRILNPPHAGAQAEVDSNGLTVGSGDDCDVILSDPLLKPRHAVFRLLDGLASVEVLDGAAHLDGREIMDSVFKIPAGQVLTLGSTHFAFGPPDSPWPALTLPVIQTLGSETKTVSLAEPNASPAPAPGATKRPAPWKLGLAGLGAVLLVGFLLVFFYNAEQKRAGQSIVRQNGNADGFFTVDMHTTNEDNKAAEAAAMRIRKEVSGATVDVLDRSGKSFLRVYVRSRGQANDVQRIINSSPYPLFSEIVSLNEIETSAEMMAGMEGYALDVTLTKDGTAYWSGYLPAEENWRSVRKRLETDLPLIKENVSKLTYGSEIEKEALRLLAEADIETNPTLSFTPREVVFSGSIPENQMHSWSGVLAALKEKYGSLATIVDQISSGKPVTVTKNPFHSAVVGVSMGGIPAVLLADGQRIFEGTILKDGSVITQISEESLTIKGPEGLRSLPLQSFTNPGTQPALAPKNSQNGG